MLAAQCAYISLVARLWSEFANVVAPPASQSATMRVASLPGAPASSRSQGRAELVADVLAGGAVDGVPLSLTVGAGIGDRTLVANDLAVLHPLVHAAFTVRVLAHIRFFPLPSTWGSRPTSLHLAAQRLVTFPWPHEGGHGRVDRALAETVVAPANPWGRCHHSDSPHPTGTTCLPVDSG